MKKQKPQPSPHARRSSRAPCAPGPAPGLAAHVIALDPLEAALAEAARHAAPYPEEADAIGNVIRYVRQRRNGRPTEVPLVDVMLTLSILLGATQRDLSPTERGLLALLDIQLARPLPSTPQHVRCCA